MSFPESRRQFRVPSQMIHIAVRVISDWTLKDTYTEAHASYYVDIMRKCITYTYMYIYL